MTNIIIFLQLADNDVSTAENLNIKQILKHLRTPWSTVLEKWSISSKYRVHEIINNTDTSIDNILEDWPLYKHLQAPELVSGKTHHEINNNYN